MTIMELGALGELLGAIGVIETFVPFATGRNIIRECKQLTTLDTANDSRTAV